MTKNNLETFRLKYCDSSKLDIPQSVIKLNRDHSGHPPIPEMEEARDAAKKTWTFGIERKINSSQPDGEYITRTQSFISSDAYVEFQIRGNVGKSFASGVEVIATSPEKLERVVGQLGLPYDSSKVISKTNSLYW